MTDSYYDEIPCPFRPGFCTIKHQKINKAKWKAGQVDRIGVGKRLLQGATRQTYFLYLAPYGCFGDRRVASFEGSVIVTTDPHRWFGKSAATIHVDDNFLNTTPHILVDELLPESVDSFMKELF